MVSYFKNSQWITFKDMLMSGKINVDRVNV